MNYLIAKANLSILHTVPSPNSTQKPNTVRPEDHKAVESTLVSFILDCVATTLHIVS